MTIHVEALFQPDLVLSEFPISTKEFSLYHTVNIHLQEVNFFKILYTYLYVRYIRKRLHWTTRVTCLHEVKPWEAATHLNRYTAIATQSQKTHVTQVSEWQNESWHVCLCRYQKSSSPHRPMLGCSRRHQSGESCAPFKTTATVGRTKSRPLTCSRSHCQCWNVTNISHLRGWPVHLHVGATVRAPCW